MKKTPLQRRGAGVPWLRAATCAAAALLAACAASGTSDQATAQPAPAGQPADTAKAQLVDPRPLPGAGAVAFHPAQPWLAWAAGEAVRILPLDAAATGERRLDIASWVADLGFSPDGALWVIADVPQLWRDGEIVCRAQGVEADRLLAVDDAGAVVAAYSHSDGVGMLRRQVWLDAQCGVADERIAPLPAGVQDAEADPGAPLGRATLQPLHPDPADLAAGLASVRLPAGAGVSGALRVSSDGRWWVLEGAQGRTLWRLDRP
ncbi:hypothetical protein [Luteimonas sp. SDU82]|uniref:hypothetical protein n=1 Tax=Luteimonas sp. SDU82 TaxID=3422592 RepID=UPI003EBAAF94